MSHVPVIVVGLCSGAGPEAAPRGAIGGMPLSLPLSLLQMDAPPGSLTGFSPTLTTHQIADLPVTQADPVV